MTAFAPVHNHTEYSALDGLSTPLEIAQRCQCIGCTAAGITDHGTVTGHLEFGKVMKAHDIKPIFGCEFYHGVKSEFGKNERDQFHFVAGAMTDEGLRNLWRMVDAASAKDRYRYVGRVNWEICERFKEGVFATSACIQGLVAQSILRSDDLPHYLHGVLDKYLNIYQDNFYVEIHTYPGKEHELLNWRLVELAIERGIPLIYATDAHFAGPEQYEIHDAFVAMQTGDSILMDPEDRKMWHPKTLYIQDEAQIRESLSYLPSSVIDEALANSAALAEKCNADLPEIRRHLAAFFPAECPWIKDDEEKAMSAAELFVTLVERGIVHRYGENAGAHIWDRAVREMEVFFEAPGPESGGGLEHYFLQAWDFCQYCDHNRIKRGPGRGSAAGAIVAYALGITDIDPLKYDLIFERFYNPGRADGFPDIDNDFPVNSRKKVRQYLMDRWGHDRVRTIGTTMRMKPKAVLDKTYKACGVGWDDKEELKKIISEVPDIDILGVDSIGWAKETDPGKTIYVMDHVGTEIVEWLEAWAYDMDYLDVLMRWLEIVEVCCGRVSGYGVHPSGVVVSDVSLTDELPCMYNRSQEVQVTCFPMTDVDKRMFVKQDLLGLRNLDTLQDWEDEAIATYVKPGSTNEHVEDQQWLHILRECNEIDWSKVDDQDPEQCPPDMWNMLAQGLTLGIFQIEKGYARQLCKEFKPTSIEDLGIIVSLNRPGPIRSGAPASFIVRRNGGEDDKFDGRKIPLLANILEPTYGWFLYQEQVIAYFTALGYNLSDADAVRKILGKKKPEQMRALRNGEGEWEAKGYRDIAYSQLGQEMADVIWSKLEDFAKYSFNKSHAIAYATIAFRTLYCKFWLPAQFTIACIRTNADDAGDYVSEGRRIGVEVRPPHIHHSEADIAVKDKNIYFGFSNVKGIGKGAGEYICKLRKDYEIVSPDDLRTALETEQGFWEAENKTMAKVGISFKKRSPRQQLAANKINLLVDAGGFDEYIVRDISLPKIQKLEKELLQVILTDECDEIFERNGEDVDRCHTYYDLEVCGEGEGVYIPGVISTLDPKRTKKDNKPMGIVTIEYQGEQTEFVVFPREWASYKFLWKERTPAIFSLTKTDRGIRFDKAVKLT